MNLNAAAAFAPAPGLPPCPAGMGDWFDSSRELQGGLQVTEWHLPGWDTPPLQPTPPLAH